MLISNPTFLAISSLRGGLLERAVCQQKKANHQAKPSNIHYIWKNTSNPLKESDFSVQRCKKLLTALSTGRTVVFYTPGVNEEILSKRTNVLQMFSSRLCCFWKAEGRWIVSRTVESLTEFRQAWLRLHMLVGLQSITVTLHNIYTDLERFLSPAIVCICLCRFSATIKQHAAFKQSFPWLLVH